MNLTHLHLVLNHFPIIGTLLSFLLLLLGTISKKEDLQRTAMSGIIIMAIIAIPVLLTGEPAEESVENIPGISETLIEAHEEAAELAFWVMEITGGFALLSLLGSKLNKNFGNIMRILTLIFSLVSFGLMARTGYLGGKIRHTELTANTPTNSTVTDTANTEEEED